MSPAGVDHFHALAAALELSPGSDIDAIIGAIQDRTPVLTDSQEDQVGVRLLLSHVLDDDVVWRSVTGPEESGYLDGMRAALQTLEPRTTTPPADLLFHVVLTVRMALRDGPGYPEVHPVD